MSELRKAKKRLKSLESDQESDLDALNDINDFIIKARKGDFDYLDRIQTFIYSATDLPVTTFTISKTPTDQDVYQTRLDVQEMQRLLNNAVNERKNKLDKAEEHVRSLSVKQQAADLATERDIELRQLDIERENNALEQQIERDVELANIALERELSEKEQLKMQHEHELKKMELQLQIEETKLLREREEREANRASIESLRDTLKDDDN